MKISLSNINKTFYLGRKKEKAKEVLKKINFNFFGGKTYFILGPSGSGKSTLLSILGLLDTPTSGKVLFDDQEASDVQTFIEEHISFVFQEYNLFENLSVFDNLSIYEDDVNRLNQYLIDFNCDFSLNTKVKYLSGGEKQRLSILRAYLKGGDIFLLDEPTGNLDSENSYKIMDMVQAMAKDKLVIVVSHDTNLAYQYADEILILKDGTIDSIKENKKTINLDFASKGKDALIELYNLVTTFKQIECYVFDELIQLNNQNYISACDNLYEKHKNEVVEIRLIKKENKLSAEPINKKDGKAKFLNKFSFKNILGRKGRTIASFVVLFISSTLLFLLGNLAFYNVGAYLQDNLNQLGYVFTDLDYDYNYQTYYKGATIHTISEECDGYLVKTSSGKYDPITQNSYIIDFYMTNSDNVEICGLEYKIGEEVYISDSLFNIDIYKDTFDFVNGFSLPISSTLIKLNDTVKNNPEFNKYFVITSYDYFFNNYYALIDPFSTPLRIDTPQNLIEGSTLNKVVSYNSEEILLGRGIENTNEIIIEKSLYDRYLNVGVDLLNKTTQILSLNQYNLSNAPESYFDLSLLFNETKIVGVIENTPYDCIHLDKNVYRQLVSQYVRFSNRAALSISNSEKSFNYLYDHNVRSQTSPSSRIYSMANAYVTQMMTLIVILIVVFLTISSIVLSIWITNVLKDRYREIAIMKCMGFKKKSIYFSFLKMILCVSVASLISGLIAGVIFTNLLNTGIISLYSNTTVLYIFRMEGLSFLIPILFSTLFPLLISLVFNKKIISIEPYHALKEFK